MTNQTKRNPSQNRRIVAIFIALIFLGICAGSTPIILKCAKMTDRVDAASNAKQIYMLLIEFNEDYGEFPSDQTATNTPKLHGYHGKYSSNYLGQLFGAGYINTEEIFYAKTGSPLSKRPDNKSLTPEETLSLGECGFTYIKGTQLSQDIDDLRHNDSPTLEQETRHEAVTSTPAPPPLPASKETTTPVCPRCSQPMKLRTARRGSNSGNQFWGCSSFPKCRGIRNA